VADGSAPSPDKAGVHLTDDACEAIIATAQRCADTPEARTPACAQARRADCDQATATMSVAYHDAVVECFTATMPCGDADTCIRDQLAKSGPTEAMRKVKVDFCATCGDEAGPDCAAAFFRISADDGMGAGFTVLEASDVVVRDIDAKCTGSALDVAGQGATDCPSAFVACAQGELENAKPQLPDACLPPDTSDGG
jgi:hypothetical protein